MVLSRALSEHSMRLHDAAVNHRCCPFAAGRAVRLRCGHGRSASSSRTIAPFTGPAEQYDLIGATQFALLYVLRLREHHRLLDIGCGSLRAGRMLISYLRPGGYTGVDQTAG